MNGQHLTPLLTRLREHARRNRVQFHIPGHKKGVGMAPEFRTLMGDQALSIDLINIAPLDDLHNPQGALREAQVLAAEAFGADRTFFSVQGTSCAIHVMILSVCRPGDKILLPRNVHKSVLTGIILSGARPVFLAPEVDAVWGIAHGASANAFRRAIAAHPDARAVLVPNPTYYGVATDLPAIVSAAHAQRIPVLVDEAHGVHFHFHEALPSSAMQAGADLAAVSVHKLGGSLTQSSVLNLREGLVDPSRVQAMLSMMTTTSTSYLLLASLDAARKQLALHGRRMVERVLTLANEGRRAIAAIPGLACFGSEILDPASARVGHDPAKLCISLREIGLTGVAAEQILRDEFNLEVELSDMGHVLCVISLGDTEESVDALVSACTALGGRQGASASLPRRTPALPAMPVLVMAPRTAFYAPAESIPIGASAGRIMAESVMVYPPGIPILLPGEAITPEAIAYILAARDAGLPVQGMEDASGRLIKVVQTSPP